MRRCFRSLAIGLYVSALSLFPISVMAGGGLDTVELAQSAGTIKDVVVEGAQRIDPETVKSYLLVQPGDVFDPSKIDRSLKSLYSTGLFADVSLRRRGDFLVVKVVENPAINRIAFEGNEEVETPDLKVHQGTPPEFGSGI